MYKLKSLHVITGAAILTWTMLISTNGFGQGNEPDFNYETVSEIGDKVGFIRFDISPVEISYMGNFIGFGVGARLAVSDIGDKFSADAKWDYNYFNYSTDKNKLNVVVEDYTKAPMSALDFSVGYTFKKEIKDEKWSLKLKKTVGKEYVAYLPAKTVYRYVGRLGFNSTISSTRANVSYLDSVTDDFGVQTLSVELGGGLHLTQRQNCISLGAERKVSANTAYKTDRFGVKMNSIEKSIYVDLLIGIGGELPTLYKTKFEDSSRPNEITSIEQLTPLAQEQVGESIRRLPIGLRIGTSQGSRKLHQFGWNAEFSLFPQFYAEIIDVIQLRLGVSYRFMKAFK